MKVSCDTAKLVEFDVGYSGQVGKEPALNNGVHNFAFVAWKPVLLPPDLYPCLLYTSDAADERLSVDLGGRRIIKKKFFSSRRRHTRCG